MKTLLRLLHIYVISASVMWAGDPGKLSADERIGYRFPDESRKAIIRNIADAYGLNLIWSDEFQDQKISLHLQSVNWREALEATLHGSGYTYFSRGNVVYIVRVGNTKEENAGLRDTLEQALQENFQLRESILLLLKAEQPLTSDQRNDATALLSPDRRGVELLKFLQEQMKQLPQPASPSATP